MDWFVAALCGVVGLALGSFANVVIYRVPAGRSVVRPASACPRCGNALKTWHNIPVLSWLVLRGKCGFCGARIRARYPLVELAMGLLFALVGGVLGFHWGLGLLLGLSFFSIVLSMIDFDVQRLPNPIVGGFAVVSGGLILTHAIVEGQWDAALRSVIGAAALGAFYFLVFFIYPKGMGWGDVKLAPVIGAVLAWWGWPALVVGALAAFLWGSVVGVSTAVVRGRLKGVKIPFGPWMFLGAWTGLLLGDPIADWYLSVMGLA